MEGFCTVAFVIGFPTVVRDELGAVWLWVRICVKFCVRISYSKG